MPAASPRERIAALSGPNLALEIAHGLPASAVVAAHDMELATRVAARGRLEALPALREQRHPGRRAVRGAEERPRDRRRCRRPAGLGRQRQGRPDHPRPGRDDPAGHRDGREPADVRRPGRRGRRRRHLGLAAVAEPPAGRGARQGPPLGRHRAHAARARPRAPTPSTRRWPWRAATTSRCPSRSRSTRRCSRARACGAACSTCWRASRRTSWPTTSSGSSASGFARA